MTPPRVRILAVINAAGPNESGFAAAIETLRIARERIMPATTFAEVVICLDTLLAELEPIGK